MTRVRAWVFLWCSIVTSAALCTASDLTCSFAGVARDENHAPLAGVRITITQERNFAVAYQATSGPSGDFRFTDIAPGEYRVVGVLSGYVDAPPLVIHISRASTHVPADVNLTKNSAIAGPGTAGTVPSPSAPMPEFKESGLHGLIDPGGYSASTSDAASGLVQGIAELRRTDESYDPPSASDWPCDLEPRLLTAVAQHPHDLEANRHLGQFYSAHYDGAKAVPYFKQALGMGGGDHVSAQELANAYVQAGEFEQARTLLSSLAEHSSDPGIHQTLARAEEGTGIFLQAAQEYRIADKEAPSEESLFGIAYEMILAGSAAESVPVLVDGVTRYPRSIRFHLGLGAAELLVGSTSEGIRSLLEATDIDPNDPRPYPFLATASLDPGSLSERVRSSFRRFAEHAPDNADANYFYALALSRESNTNSSQVEILLKRSLQSDPSQARTHLLLGTMLARRGANGAALVEYESAASLDQYLSEAHYRLALAYKRIGRADESARESDLYRVSKDRQVPNHERIDISRFISVMDLSDRQRKHAGTCPALSH